MRASSLLLGGVLMSALLAPAATNAQTNYRNAFVALYNLKPDSKLARAGCQVCHAGNDLKKRNGYGDLVAKALGKDKATDEEVTEAMKKVETQEVRIRVIDLLKMDAPPGESKTLESASPSAGTQQ